MRQALDAVDELRLAGDLDGLLVMELETWGAWRAVMRAVRVHGATRERYRAAYKLEAQLDRVVRAAGWLAA